MQRAAMERLLRAGASMAVSWLVCVVVAVVLQSLFTDGRNTMESLDRHYMYEDPSASDTIDRIQQPPDRHDVIFIQHSSLNNVTGRFPQDLRLKMRALERDFTLDLELNPHVVAPSHQFHVVDIYTNRTETLMTADSCYYQGRVASSSPVDDSTWAAFSTCNGLSGSFFDGEEVYVIEPVRTGKQHSLGDRHYFYRLDDIPSTNEETSCGHPHLHESNLNESARLGLNGLAKQLAPRHRVVRQAQWDGWRFVELMFVIDNNMLPILGGQAQVQDFVLQAANVMDMIYKQINIRIALTTVVLWTKGNPITITPDPKETLNNFLRYRERNWLRTSNTPHDNAQLISATDFSGATVGLGRLNSMCSTTGSGGISQHKRGHPASMVATVVAHEMGHNLNMQHDDGRTCNDCPPEKPCLMAATAGPRSTRRFSRCSREDKDTLIRSGGAHCLANRPTKLFAHPVCGNGFREGKEECDCGSVQECIDKCCNAKTCRLTPGSQCAGGDCCRNCQFMPAGTRCREKKNTCDLTEVCTGFSAECPNDSVYRNGLPCLLTPLPGNAYCWNGECVTITTQCRTLWGPEGRQAHELCYERLNKVGNQFGNCGKRAGSYVQCAARDVLCGQLQCSAPPSVRYPVIGLSKRALQVVYRLGNERVTCRQASVDLGSDIPDPGLAVDGTACGTGHICMNKRCVAVSSLQHPRCPADASGRECSGRGMCDDRLRCHCQRGFYPPNCGRTRQPVQPTPPGSSVSVLENPGVRNGNLGDASSPTLPRPLPPPDPESGGNGTTKKSLSPGLIGGIAAGALFFLIVVMVICCPGCFFAKCPGCRPKCLGGDQEPAEVKPVKRDPRVNGIAKERKQPTAAAAPRARPPPKQAGNGKHLLPVGSDLAKQSQNNNRIPLNNMRSPRQRPNMAPPQAPGRPSPGRPGPGRPALHRPPIPPPSSAPPPRPVPRKNLNIDPSAIYHN